MCVHVLFASPPRSQCIADSEAPRIIVVDLSRSDEVTPWAAIESIKNGEILSGKHRSRAESFCRPHVIILANRPADNVGVEISSDRVVEVEIRRFIEELESAPMAPTTVAELRTFPGVKTFGAAAIRDDIQEDSGAMMEEEEEEEDHIWISEAPP